jgi:hypothetical protein
MTSDRPQYPPDIMNESDQAKKQLIGKKSTSDS